MPDTSAYFMEPNFTDNAIYTLHKRYLLKDEDGNVLETPKEMLLRVARAVASQEKDKKHWTRVFYDMMASLEFLPNSPTLMNAGVPNGQLAACFVLPVDDSITAIFDAIKHAAMIHKSGGGTGFSFSRLRPAGSTVNSTGGVASGPVSFMRIFNSATEQIKQGGKRRGANMAILRVDHPDIVEFIRAKEKDGEFNNFNFSVGITNTFMEAVKNDAFYDLIDPYSKKKTPVKAREIFDLLVEKAWSNGEPGIIFLDKMNEKNPTPKAGDIESTNPCGEQPLLPWESCNLGSINLVRFIDKKTREPDYAALSECAKNAVRFLDDVIDNSEYPLPAIGKMTCENRKIGLGVMGFADALFIMGIPYDSEDARIFATTVIRIIRESAFAASMELAKEKGAFPACANSIFKKTPVRNATLTTIAPTGTLSILAGCSSGIEPVFALAFTRHILDGSELKEFNPILLEKLAEYPEEVSRPILDAIAETGSLAGIPVPEELKKVFVTAGEISPMAHLAIQARFQSYTDNAVSKTINLPASAHPDDIRNIYLSAYEMGCKGVTVYRDGSRSGQPMQTGKKSAAQEEKKTEKRSERVSDRPDVLQGFTQKIKTGLGTMYLTVNELDGKPFEVFATVGKSGRSIMAKAESIGRLVSLALRSGIPVGDIVRQIKGIGGEHPVFHGHGGMLLSIPDAVARVLEERYMESPVKSELDVVMDMVCPECGGKLVYSEGCVVCPKCAWSRCG